MTITIKLSKKETDTRVYDQFKTNQPVSATFVVFVTANSNTHVHPIQRWFHTKQIESTVFVSNTINVS